MEDVLIPLIVVPVIFIGLPWLVFHYITRWKTAATLTNSDEQMLFEMNELARRLEDRLETVERLVASDNPEWRPARIESERSADFDTIRRLERNR